MSEQTVARAAILIAAIPQPYRGIIEHLMSERDEARAAIAAMPDTKAKARNDALREAAAVADDVMISSMNGALSGLPEYARNRESMANSAERIKIRILALIDKEPTP